MKNQDMDKALQSEVETLKKTVEDAGIAVRTLCIFMFAGDTLMGQVDELVIRAGGELAGKVHIVTDPKRIVRIEHGGANPGEVRIGYHLSDLDFVEAGEVEVQADVAYRVEAQSLRSQRYILKLLAQYLERRAAVRAAEAGLILNQKPRILTPNSP